MKRSTISMLVGLMLVLLGLLFLLQNLGIIPTNGGRLWAAFWAFLFAAGGFIFLAVYARDREQWWALIPGFTLIGLGALISMGMLFPSLGALLGSVFFLFISIAFWAIYFTAPRNWWAVIPGGVLLTLALVVAVAEVLPGTTVGAVLFLGLAATFGLLYFLPTPEGRMRWAVWPALGCGLMGLLVLGSMPALIGWVWPLVLIGAGIYLVARIMVRRNAE